MLITWPTDKKEVALITGDLAVLVPFLRAKCHAEWLDNLKCYGIPGSSVPVLAEELERIAYNYREQVSPSEKPAAPAPQPETTPLRPKPTTSPSPVEGAAGPTVSGVVETVQMGMTAKNAPTRQLKLGKTWYTCYTNTIFDFLDKAQGKDCEFFLDARKTVVGIKRIAKREFTEGKIPVIEMDESRSGDLFA